MTVKGLVSGLGFIAILLFNQELAKRFEVEGVNPKWLWLLVGGFFVWGVLKANYQRFADVERAKNQALSQVSELKRKLADRPIDPPLTLDSDASERYTGLLVRNRSDRESAFNVSIEEIVASAHKLIADPISEIRPGEVKRLHLHSVSLARATSPVEKFMAPDAFLEEKAGPLGKTQISVQLNYSDVSGAACVSKSDVEWTRSTGHFKVTHGKVSWGPR